MAQLRQLTGWWIQKEKASCATEKQHSPSVAGAVFGKHPHFACVLFMVEKKKITI